MIFYRKGSKNFPFLFWLNHTSYLCHAMQEQDLKQLRTDYVKNTLSDEEAGNNPFSLFTNWFNEALLIEQEANAFIIATGSSQPSARVVLLKELRGKEFVFFTNYNSRKGQEIANNPKVGMLFFFQQLQRQIRVEGIATKVSAEESDAYFYSRPIESQIGAIASTQSQELKDRITLENRIIELQNKYASEPIKRPGHWGGYAIKPNLFEFWQGRASRLHDRVQFTLTESEWLKSRLYP